MCRATREPVHEGMARSVGGAVRLFGVRRKADAREDSKLSPLQLILTALLLAATFIGVLLLVVRLATS